MGRPVSEAASLGGWLKFKPTQEDQHKPHISQVQRKPSGPCTALEAGWEELPPFSSGQWDLPILTGLVQRSGGSSLSLCSGICTGTTELGLLPPSRLEQPGGLGWAVKIKEAVL